VDLRQLEILQAIAETGSFTACGRKLNVSQSAISRQILLLEEELGEPLFLRVGRQVRMTPAAESLVQLGKRVFLDVRDTVGAITDRTRELRGTLRLSGGMTVCLYVFPPLLKHLRRVHPHLDVRLTVAMAGRSVQEIRGGRVDAGLLTLPVEECAAIAGALEDSSTLAHALHFLAMVRLAAGHASSGRPLAEEAVALARGLDDPFCLTIALASHGVLLLALSELDAASAALEESVQRSRQADDVWAVALPLRNLAIIACRRGEYERARRLLEDSLQGLRALGERWFVSRSIETLAQVLVAQEEHVRAARLFGAAEGLREAVGASVLAMYRADYDRAIVAARDALGPQVFERCWQEGRRQTPDAVVAYALGESITMV